MQVIKSMRECLLGVIECMFAFGNHVLEQGCDFFSHSIIECDGGWWCEAERVAHYDIAWCLVNGCGVFGIAGADDPPLRKAWCDADCGLCGLDSKAIACDAIDKDMVLEWIG